MGDTPLDAFHQRVWLVALVMQAITAWFSSGYYAADEHYQVIAFAQHKLGELSAEELPWEYDARIRSALMPGIAYAVIGTSRSLLTANPFHIAFLLRLMTALFAMAVVRSFVRTAMDQVSYELHKPFVLLSYFLWFLPYQHVRFAAETWSGLLFLLGLSQMLGKNANRRTLLATGLCFGLSLLVKPVMGIACMSAIAWSLRGEKERRSPAFHLLAGLTTALVLGFLVDRWFYGAPTPTLWNHLGMAVIGDASHPFETYPWYYYLPWVMKFSIWPIGLLLVGALAWLTFTRTGSLITWCVWPCLIVLSIIPHKEVRFLFPLVDLAPLMLVLAWQGSGKAMSLLTIRGVRKRRTLMAVSVALVVVNATGLMTSSLTPAGSGRTRLAERLRGVRPEDPLTLGYSMGEPRIWEVRIPSFYLRSGITDTGSHDPCEAGAGGASISTEGPFLLIGEDQGGNTCTPLNAGYRMVEHSEPHWASVLLDLYNSERHGPYVLYARDRAPSRPSEP